MLKQTQRLSPLQIQTIKLIELPAPELEQRIQKELEENPVLEEVVDDSPEGEEKKNVSLSDLQSKGLSRVLSSITVQKHQFFGTQLSPQSNSHIYT